jgi:hypothetical protein
MIVTFEGKRLTIDSHSSTTCDHGALASQPKAIMNTAVTEMSMLRAMQYLVKSVCQYSGLKVFIRHNTAVRAEKVAAM